MRQECKNSALILTTHTIEEAECLADKIGIMVAGKIKCLGSLEQLQQRFGGGFLIEISMDMKKISQQEIESFSKEQRLCSALQTVKAKLREWTEKLEFVYGCSGCWDFEGALSADGHFSSQWNQLQQG